MSVTVNFEQVMLDVGVHWQRVVCSCLVWGESTVLLRWPDSQPALIEAAMPGRSPNAYTGLIVSIRYVSSMQSNECKITLFGPSPFRSLKPFVS